MLRSRLALGCLASAAAVLVTASAEVATPTHPATPGGPTSAAGSAISGFSVAGAERQRAIEQRLDASMHSQDLRGWMQRMAAQPNQVGSAHDRDNAETVAALARSWGWRTRIETFQVLYPTPTRVALELVAPRAFTASLREPPIEGDSTSQNPQGALPPYLAYGADGDVTGELVYVNYGMPGDYQELDRRGISVQGRVVIVRYGGGWRGLKPKLAAEHGALGCIIYSDPRDDGYFAADAYPRGAGRPAEGVQRGSIMDVALAPGDPLTPGIGSTPKAARLALKDAPTILKIPALPISYADAMSLLTALAGPVASAGWRGALPLTYHVGPGPARVHLVVKSEWTQKIIYDVIAELPGSEHPEEWVVRGNHRDGWVFGAEDPLSGHVAMLAEMKAIGELRASGWRPKRTLVYASWDAEEPGLIGSTEWVETHLDELHARAVAYVNSDVNGQGVLAVEGSHSLQRLINEAAAEVRDPQTGATLLARARATAQVLATAENATEEQRAIAKLLASGADLPIEALGSGSDYTPFLQHAGVASLNLSFRGDQPAGDYHSTYDSFDHFVKVVDPEFAYEVALARLGSRLMLRLADADIVPYRFADLAVTATRYVAGLRKLTDQMREATITRNRLLDAHAYDLVVPRHGTFGPPERESEVPPMDFAPLEQAITALGASAARLDARLTALDQGGGGAVRNALSSAQAHRLAELLRGAELRLTDERGLPGRPWYRHLLYAPGLLTGYAAKTLPGVREAIEGRRWEEAREYIARTARVLEACRVQLEAATAAAGG